jgi:hypothetical protein
MSNPKSIRTSPVSSTLNAGEDNEEVRQLREENERLRAELEDVKAGNLRKSVKPSEPSFGISEGTREELERTGKATSPFTGKPLTEADLPANTRTNED